tara:strand:- start:337 stop:1464 length:1128 start_codon:yes stop_codon:yes gene_type:complete
MITCLFSEVVESPIYRAIVSRLDDSELTVRYGLITNGPSSFSEWLQEGRPSTTIVDIGGNGGLPGAWRSIRATLREENPKVLVCFGQRATLLGFTASVGPKPPLRAYARYHSTSHRVEGNRRGLAYDWLCNRLADFIVAPNGNVVRALVDDEGVDPAQIVTIPFGIRLADFAEPPADRVDAVRRAHQIDPGRTTIGMISRFIEIKGWRYAIDPLLQRLLADSELQLVIANAVGDLESEIRQSFRPVSDQVVFIRHESDNAALFKVFDVFLHVPVTPTVEAFGLVYIEAMAAGIPSVITSSGIANDFADDGKNCLVVPHRDPEAIGRALDQLLGSASLRARLKSGAIASVEAFEIGPMAEAYAGLFHRLEQASRSR